jgi:ABC-type phosphate transport system ATPase subunit
MAIARMIALPRTLLLLDDHLLGRYSGMDQIEATLLRYAADTGCTLILSTHSPAQALRSGRRDYFSGQGENCRTGNGAERAQKSAK